MKPMTYYYLPNSLETAIGWERGNPPSPNFATTHSGPFPATHDCVQQTNDAGNVSGEPI